MKKPFLYPILVFTYIEKNKNIHTITINLKYQPQHGMMNLTY